MSIPLPPSSLARARPLERDPSPVLLLFYLVHLIDSCLIGVYYQAFMLAPSQYRRVASWICGWLYVVGNITITLSVNFGTTLFFVACINVFESEPGVGVLAGEPYQVVLIFIGITLLCNAVSALGNKYLPWLDVRSHPM